MDDKPKGRKKRPVRNRYQKEWDRAEVARLMRKGWTRTAIAERLKVSVATVSSDWAIVLKEMNDNREADAKAATDIMVESLLEVVREAWDAYERSKKSFEKTVEEETTGGGMVGGLRTKNTRIREGRLPSNEYLNTIAKCFHQIAELRGLYPSKTIDLNAQIVNWDLIMGASDASGDVIEAEILRVATGAQAGAAPQLPDKRGEAVEVNLDSPAAVPVPGSAASEVADVSERQAGAGEAP